MIVRQALPEEAPAIYSVIEQGRAKLSELGIDQWQGANPSREAIEKDVEYGRSYVVEEDWDIAATMMLSRAGEPCYDDIAGMWLTQSLSWDPRYITVHRLAVADNYLGRGFAKELLRKAEKIARDEGYESIRIDTHPGNEPMHKLLSKCGFTRCGTVMLDESLQEPTRERIGYERLV